MQIAATSETVVGTAGAAIAFSICAFIAMLIAHCLHGEVHGFGSFFSMLFSRDAFRYDDSWLG